MLASPDQLSDSSVELKSYVGKHEIGLILGIHAYKAGQLLHDVQVPYILVLGGTDINIDSTDINKMKIMTEAVKNAGHVVAFSEDMIEKFYGFWPDYSRQKTSVIPQAVCTEPSDFKLGEHIANLALRDTPGPSLTREKSNKYNDDLLDQTSSLDGGDGPHNLGIPDMKIFIIVGGIRPVKNPLFLVKEFSEWRENNSQSCYLVFIGPEIDSEYFKKFKEEINRLPGVVHLDRLEPADTHAAIRDSCALVNSSNSEGMSLAVLEAMSLGTPVVVRDIPGNTAIVADGKTGLVYKTPKEFLDKIEQLVDDPPLIDSLTHNAREYISKHHSLQEEEDAYVTIVKRLVGQPKGDYSVH